MEDAVVKDEDYFGGFEKIQKDLSSIRKSPNIEETLDQFEELVDGVIESEYARIYLRDHTGEFQLVRNFTVDDMDVQWAYVKWAVEMQEPTVIPDESEHSSSAIMILPLVGNVNVVGVAVLWLDQDSSECTQGQFSWLSMIANEAASRIEAHFFREKLEESQEKMVDLVESVPHGIMAITADRKVWLLNATLEVMLGVRRDDVIGHEFGTVLPTPAAMTINHLLSTGGAKEEELFIDIIGQESVFGLTVTPMHLDSRSQATGHVVICRDLGLSREVSKLREVDALKNDFLSLVSHELRTPLTSILAYTEALMMEGMVEEPEDRKEYLGIIYKEGERLTRLINDVLDLAKMEAGKMDYIYGENQINDIIRGAVSNSSASAKKKNHTIEIFLEEPLPEVRCDYDRIMQVMMNLLSNSIKYTPDSGYIRISTSLVHLHKSKGEVAFPAVRVEVEDNGVGISQENVNKVFSRFEQIESMDHHSDGTGLGMPICQMIIEQGHSGTIGLESTLGEGSKFFFTVPVL